MTVSATGDLERELSCMGLCKMQDSYGLVLLKWSSMGHPLFVPFCNIPDASNMTLFS